MTYMATPLPQSPCPRSFEVYNLGRPFLGHHYFILSLSDLCMGVIQILKEKTHFIWPHPSTRILGPGVMKFTIWVDPSFKSHHNYILNWSYPCLGVKKILKGIMYFHNMTYMATPQRKNPCLGGHEIYNLGRPFLGHHQNILSLFDLCIGGKKIFKRNNAFSLYDLYGHTIAKNPCPGGHEIYNLGRPFHGHYYYTLSLSETCP